MVAESHELAFGDEAVFVLLSLLNRGSQWERVRNGSESLWCPWPRQLWCAEIPCAGVTLGPTGLP